MKKIYTIITALMTMVCFSASADTTVITKMLTRAQIAEMEPGDSKTIVFATNFKDAEGNFFYASDGMVLTTSTIMEELGFNYTDDEGATTNEAKAATYEQCRFILTKDVDEQGYTIQDYQGKYLQHCVNDVYDFSTEVCYWNVPTEITRNNNRAGYIPYDSDYGVRFTWDAEDGMHWIWGAGALSLGGGGGTASPTIELVYEVQEASTEKMAELTAAYQSAIAMNFSRLEGTELYDNYFDICEEIGVVVEVGFATDDECDDYISQLNAAVEACTAMINGINASEALIDKATAVYEKTQPALFNLTPNAEQFSSNAPCPSEGNIAYLVDDNVNTFFHSDWTGSYSAQVGYDLHELYVSGLNADIKDFIVSTYDRNADNDHIATMEVYGGTVEKDEENPQLGFFTCTSGDEPLATIELEGARPAAHEADFSLGDTGYEALCFRVTNTKNKAGNDNYRVYFHVAEFRLYANDGKTFDEPTYKVSEEKQQALMDAIDALQEAVNDFNAEQFEALQAALQAAITSIEEEVLFDVTYEYVWKGQVVATETIKAICGHNLPKPEYALPFGVTVETPEGTVTAPVTVQLPCKAELPFQYYKSFNAVKKWYTIASHESYRELWRYDADLNYIPLDCTAVNEEDIDAFSWAIIGDPFAGFSIVNKKAGADYVLANGKTMEGNTGVDTRPYPTKIDELTDDMVSVFKAHAGTTDVSAWFGFFCEKENKDVWMNRRADNGGAPVLAYWSSAGDAGSNLNFAPVGGEPLPLKQISTIDELSNECTYVITARSGEGSLAWNTEITDNYLSLRGVETFEPNGKPDEATQEIYTAEVDPADPSTAWQLIQHEGQWYMYNVARQAFVSINNRDYIFTNEVTPLVELRQNTEEGYEGTFGFNATEDEKHFICICTNEALYPVRNWKWDDHGGIFYIYENPNVQPDQRAIELVTGIQKVLNDTADAPIYDLFGRKVSAIQKGVIYIQNGKKFMVK